MTEQWVITSIVAVYYWLTEASSLSRSLSFSCSLSAQLWLVCNWWKVARLQEGLSVKFLWQLYFTGVEMDTSYKCNIIGYRQNNKKKIFFWKCYFCIVYVLKLEEDGRSVFQNHRCLVPLSGHNWELQHNAQLIRTKNLIWEFMKLCLTYDFNLRILIFLNSEKHYVCN